VLPYSTNLTDAECELGWVVERTDAWTERWRRTVMHHDRKLAFSTARVWLAEARMLFNKLAYQV
jgi:putative transposase